MAQDTANSTDDQNKKRNGPRSTFPRIALSKVIVLAKQIYELGEGDPVPRLVVFDRLGKSPDSGPSRMLVTTSNAYGLTTGSYQAERLGITDRGRGLVQATDEDVARTYAVKALLDNPLFVQFYEKYQNKSVPQEPVAIDYLKQAGNLPDTDAKAAFEIFLTNMKDYGFIKEMSGRPTIVSQDMMDVKRSEHLDASSAPPYVRSGHNSTSHDERTAQTQPSKQYKTLSPQFNFNIQVQLPDNADAETYDAIFKSMSEHLLNATSE